MNFYEMWTILETKGTNMDNDITQSVHDGVTAANRELAERQKREFYAKVLPRLMKRLEETDRLLARAGGNRPDVASQRESNQAAFNPEAGFPVVLARLQASDKLLHRLRPASRYDRLWGAIASQRDRNMHDIDWATGRD